MRTITLGARATAFLSGIHILATLPACRPSGESPAQRLERLRIDSAFTAQSIHALQVQTLITMDSFRIQESELRARWRYQPAYLQATLESHYQVTQSQLAALRSTLALFDAKLRSIGDSLRRVAPPAPARRCMPSDSFAEVASPTSYRILQDTLIRLRYYNSSALTIDSVCAEVEDSGRVHTRSFAFSVRVPPAAGWDTVVTLGFRPQPGYAFAFISALGHR